MSSDTTNPSSDTTIGFTPVGPELRRASAEKTWLELWPLLEEKKKKFQIAPEDFNRLIFPLLESALTTAKVPRAFQVIEAVGMAEVPETVQVQWYKLNGKAAAQACEVHRVSENARKLLYLATHYPGDGTRVAAWVAVSVLLDLLDDMEKFDVSEPLHRENVAAALQLFGPGHRNVLDVQNDLANALHAQGKHAEAEQVLLAVLSACEHVFGPEHAGTLKCHDNLALALHLQGKHAEAEQEFRKVLAIRLRVLGAAHFDTLSCRNNLALELSAQGKYAEEEQEHRAVLATRERLLGPENPQTLWTRSLLIYTQRIQNKHAMAEAGLRDLLKIRERILGPDHPDTVKTRIDLAATLRVQGKHQESEKVHRELLGIRERSFGLDHPEVYKSCFALAFALLYTGDLNEANKYAQRNEQGCLKHFGPDHSLTREGKKLRETIQTELNHRSWFEGFKERWGKPPVEEPIQRPEKPPI